MSLTLMYRQNTPDMSHDVFRSTTRECEDVEWGGGRGDVGAGTLARCRCDETRGAKSRKW